MKVERVTISVQPLFGHAERYCNYFSRFNAIYLLSKVMLLSSSPPTALWLYPRIFCMLFHAAFAIFLLAQVVL